MAFLCQIRTDGSRGESWEVSHRPLVVGRGNCADACIDDDSLSRSHFLIIREHEEFFLIDLDSRNGTWVDGEPVSARKLSPNENIMAGQSLFCFLLERGLVVRPILALLPEFAVAAGSRRQTV